MNEKLRKHIKKLMGDPSYRRERGLFCIEGSKTASEVDEDIVDNVIVSESFICSTAAFSCEKLLDSDFLTVVSDDDMRKLSDTVTPQGIILIARMRTYVDTAHFMEAEEEYRLRHGIRAPLILILETIQDPGNLGTIVRSAEAAGATAIVADRGTADLYAPKTVRSTMGSLLRIPYMSTDDLGDFVRELRDFQKISIFAAAPGAELCYSAADLRGPAAVMIGNESKGLSERAIMLSDYSIYIPMIGDTESLNAAIAAAVILYEALRQRA